MPKTIKAKLLLGWMPEEEAMKILNNCVFDPPLTEAQKRELWQSYVGKTNAIQREYQAPKRKAYQLSEKIEIGKFLKKMKNPPYGHLFSDVLKLDPSQLII